MVARGRVRGPRAKSCRFPPPARKLPIPATGRSFEIQINDVHIYRIPVWRQMSQISRASQSRRLPMALQDRLDALKADFESGRFPLKPTKEALDTMRRATEELIA